MTSTDKSNICSGLTPETKLLETSAPGSISSEKYLQPYWNDHCLEMSSNLWLPTEIVLRDSVLISSSGLLNGTVDGSWFSTNLRYHQNKNSQRIFSRYCTYLVVGCTDCEHTKIKSKKIRIYPDIEQRKILDSWFSAGRFAYNDTVAYLKQSGTVANWKSTKPGILHNLPEWTRQTPYQVKSVAIRDACYAVKAAKAKYKQSGIFNVVKFRAGKDGKQNCFIPKQAITEHGVYHTVLGKLKVGEPLPVPQGDGRLIKENRKYFLCVSVLNTTIQSENQARIVAIDPGIRTFVTFFSPEACGKIGFGDFSRIQRLCHYLDTLISKRANSISHKQRYRMSKAIDRMRWKIKDLINELHHKTALFLVTNFDVILLPSFETKEMGSKVNRKIRRKSVRALLTFAHYRFEMFLKHKAKQYGKKVIIVNEAYTTKTASWTGEIVNVGSSKTIKSNNVVVDRDYNGARGIFLRALRDISMSVDE